MKAFEDDKINVIKKLKCVLEWRENIVGEGENAGWERPTGKVDFVGKKRRYPLKAFSPFPKMFSKSHGKKFCGKGLTLSQTTNFRLFPTETVCRRQF